MSTKSLRIKLIIVGDSGCGKTSLLSVYSEGYFPENHEITVFDTFLKRVTVGGIPVSISTNGCLFYHHDY